MATTTAAFEEESVVVHPTDGTAFHVRTVGDRAGSRRCLVLISGQADTRSTWSHLTHELAARGCWVLTFDNRGAGATRIAGQDAWFPRTLLS